MGKKKELINDLRLELFVQQEINKELLQQIRQLEDQPKLIAHLSDKIRELKGEPKVPQKVDTGPIFLDQVEAAL